MFCSNCGAKIEGTAKFCPECGTAVIYDEKPTEKAEPAAEESVWESVGEAPNAPDPSETVETYWEDGPVREASGTVTSGMNSTPVLVWGIIGLAFSCSFYFSFLGIIFSAVALGKVKNYLKSGGPLTGKAKVGRILAKTGLILGIILTILAAIVLLIVVVAAVGYGSMGEPEFWYTVEGSF